MQFEHHLRCCCSVCSTILPILKNGAIAFGDGLNKYYNGHVITYMCEPNFFSIDTLTCSCDATADSKNPGWVCFANFTTTCQKIEESKAKFATMLQAMENRTNNFGQKSFHCIEKKI